MRSKQSVGSLSVRGFKCFCSCDHNEAVNLEGKLTFILGPNGSGKSSLIQSIRLILAASDVKKEYYVYESDDFKQTPIEIKAKFLCIDQTERELCLEQSRGQNKKKYCYREAGKLYNIRKNQSTFIDLIGIQNSHTLNYIHFCSPRNSTWPCTTQGVLVDILNLLFQTERYTKNIPRELGDIKRNRTLILSEESQITHGKEKVKEYKMIMDRYAEDKEILKSLYIERKEKLSTLDNLKELDKHSEDIIIKQDYIERYINDNPQHDHIKTDDTDSINSQILEQKNRVNVLKKECSDLNLNDIEKKIQQSRERDNRLVKISDYLKINKDDLTPQRMKEEINKIKDEKQKIEEEWNDIKKKRDECNIKKTLRARSREEAKEREKRNNKLRSELDVLKKKQEHQNLIRKELIDLEIKKIQLNKNLNSFESDKKVYDTYIRYYRELQSYIGGPAVSSTDFSDLKAYFNNVTIDNDMYEELDRLKFIRKLIDYIDQKILKLQNDKVVISSKLNLSSQNLDELQKHVYYRRLYSSFISPDIDGSSCPLCKRIFDDDSRRCYENLISETQQKAGDEKDTLEMYEELLSTQREIKRLEEEKNEVLSEFGGISQLDDRIAFTMEKVRYNNDYEKYKLAIELLENYKLIVDPGQYRGNIDEIRKEIDSVQREITEKEKSSSKSNAIIESMEKSLETPSEELDDVEKWKEEEKEFQEIEMKYHEIEKKRSQKQSFYSVTSNLISDIETYDVYDIADLTSQKEKMTQNQKIISELEELISIMEKRLSLGNIFPNTTYQDLLDIREKEDELNREIGKYNERIATLERGLAEEENNSRRLIETKRLLKKNLILKVLSSLVCSDLLNFQESFESVIIDFQRRKLEHVNRIIKRLWEEYYIHREDINSIEIVRSQDDSDDLKYNCKLYMLKGNTKVEFTDEYASSGQMQFSSLVVRLAFAEAFSTRFKVISLDEPTSNLDDGLREKVARMLEEFMSKGFHFIIVSHDEDFMMHFNNRRNSYRLKSCDSYDHCTYLERQIT